MFYKKIYLKISEVNHYSLLLMRFLDEVLIKQSIRFFTRKGKSVKSSLVDTFISIVKKLFVSKAVIFSNFGR